jgi:hypothetical protein
MSASEQHRAEWLDAGFWERLDRLEGRHRRAQAAHEIARRRLERLTPGAAEELLYAWRHYCEVIAELEQTTAELVALLQP